MRLVVPVLAALALLPACGSTVPTSTLPPSAGAASDGLGGVVTEDGAAGAVAAGPGSTVGGAPQDAGAVVGGAPVAGSTSGGGGTAASTTGAGTAAAPGAAGAAAPRGSGPVEVGVYVVDNAEQFYKAVGVDNSFGDNRKQAQAVIDEINRTGGFAGRKVVPVFGAVDVAAGDGAAAQEQRLCGLWTQDHKVVAAVVIVRVGVLADCLTKRGVPMAVVAPENFTDGQFARWPLHFAPASLSHEQGVRLMVARAAAQGYFRATAEDLGPKVKLGYLHYDTPEQRRVAKEVFEPLIRKQGVQEVVAAAIHYPDSSQDAGQSLSAIQNSVLKFRSEGVTHVVILDNGGNLTFNFPQNAESQGFRPRYAWNTFNAIGLEQAYVAKAQLRRSVGVGWIPVYDVAGAQAPPLSAASRRCVDLITKAGATANWGSARSKSYAYCDMLFHLQAAAGKAPDLSGRSLAAAVQSLGSSMPVAESFASSYGPGRRFSAAAARDLAYDETCRCMTYRGPLLQVP